MLSAGAPSATDGGAATTAEVLRVEGLQAGYGKHVVLDDVSLTVGEGELVALLGHNGAGKTTALRAITGQLRPSRGRIQLDGRDVTGSSAALTAKLGMSMVPQGQNVFASMTIDENLRLAAAVAGGRPSNPRSAQDVRSFVLDMFPILKDRGKDKAGSLSGGQRQMVAISMALMTQPRLMLLDEPSTGLAPVLIDEVLAAVRTVNQQLGTSVLLVEQDTKRVLRVSDRVYVIKLGVPVFSGTPHEMHQQDWSQLF
ncbi:MAG: livF2 [Blastococcus sp.]|jgi:ABC-type branched-subunit amino acid transport system ATPase component|nr:livF2 [Blastococcus sp.]